MQAFDVAIIGSGPAGCVAAKVLAEAGRSVVVIDQVDTSRRKVGESLPAAARPLLQHLGLLSVVECGSHLLSYGNCSAWGSSEIVANDFIQDPNGLGWHLNRAKFDADLRAAAFAAGVHRLDGRVNEIVQSDAGFNLQLNGGELSARWLVDATGRAAVIARKLGAGRSRDDDQMAVYAWAQTAKHSADTRTLVESTPNGWWYTAPLPDQSQIIIFHTDPNYAKTLLRNPGAWDQALHGAKHIRYRLKSSALLGPLQCAEACGSRLDHFAGINWLATGDAALAFDPLSSQGLFNALYCGMKAGQAVHTALAGDRRAIQDYCAQLEQIRAAYVNRRDLYYAAEFRWAARPYWKKRIFSFNQRRQTAL